MSKQPVDPFLEIGADKLNSTINEAGLNSSCLVDVKKSEYFGRGNFLLIIHDIEYPDGCESYEIWYVTVVNLTYDGNGELRYEVAWGLFPQMYRTQHEAERAFIDCLISVKRSYNAN